MLDGSTDLTQKPSRILSWKITGNSLCENNDPVFADMKSCVDIKLERNSIITSIESSYQIEKLTSDSLIVIQRVKGVNSNDKIRKIWFLKTSKLQANFLNNRENDSIITATKNFTPTLKRNIISEVLDYYAEKKITNNFTISGNIVIFPRKQMLDVEIDNDEQTTENQKSINIFKKMIENNYFLWDITGFENFDKVIIPYILKSNVKKSKEEIHTFGITFFNKEYHDNTKEMVLNIKNNVYPFSLIQL